MCKSSHAFNVDAQSVIIVCFNIIVLYKIKNLLGPTDQARKRNPLFFC